MSFETACLRRAGGREVNEDACGTLELEDGACWVVADGLGGHRGGAIASGLVVNRVLGSFERRRDAVPDAIREHVAVAHAAMLLEQRRNRSVSGMRSTLVVLAADGSHAVWGHVGDSRLYYFRDGRLHSQTKDHSVPQQLARLGEVASAEIRGHEDRNRLLQSLGSKEEPRPAVCETRQRLFQRDCFLLCTDGFWEHVTELEMEADLAKARKPEEWLRHMETRLLERAAGEFDNYTAMAVFFNSPAAPAPPRVSKSRRLNWLTLATAAVLTLVVALALALYRQSLIPRQPASLKSGQVYLAAQRRFVSSIQEGIDSARDYEQVWIGPGIYRQDLRPVEQPVCLRGASPELTTLDTGGQPLVLSGAALGLESLSIAAPGAAPALTLETGFRGILRDLRIYGPTKYVVSVEQGATPFFVNDRYFGFPSVNCFGERHGRTTRSDGLDGCRQELK